ncbi:MAG: hypothetical protein JXR51_03480 [Bacteroidales bacterium]|nr:hypothetical protein [Bacteroidales bacterium]
MNKFISLTAIFIIICNFISCSNDSYSNKNSETIFEIDNLILNSSIEVFKSMPNPVETAEIITKTGIKFDKRILNPVSNVTYYETSNIMALNLGIYCADISYTSFYNQKELTFNYLSAIKSLASDLGISQIINKEDILRIEDNLFNKDSIKIVIENIFLKSGQYLNENNKPEIALLVEVGAWIEGLYIAMQLSTKSIHINKELVDRITQQINSLDLVIKSLDNYSNYSEIYDVLLDMKKLKNIYKKMQVKPAKKISVNNIDDFSVDTIKKNKIMVTPETFVSLYNEVNTIRNSYTQ